MRLKDFTIVLPTRNEAHNVPPFLDSLPGAIQLIVVDASQDATPDLIQTLRPENTLLLRSPSTVTEARQQGAEAASTPWLLFTDADVIFPPGYFERLLTCRDYDAVYGPKLSRDEFARFYRWFAWGQRLAHALGVPAASGSNLLVKREVFMDIGGFDLELNCNEDSELAWRIKRRGYQIGFVPDLVVYARDHRRLHRGVMRKLFHSLTRCALLYLNLIPSRWRQHDWGYWSSPHEGDQADENSLHAVISVFQMWEE